MSVASQAAHDRHESPRERLGVFDLALQKGGLCQASHFGIAGYGHGWLGFREASKLPQKSSNLITAVT